MDFTQFTAELARDFTETRLTYAGSALIVPRAPVDLEHLSMSMFPGECDRDTAYEIVGAAAGLEPLITFVWQQDDAELRTLPIDIIRFAGRAYVTMPPDPVANKPWEAFVAVRNPEELEILDALLFDLLWDNGESYDIRLLTPACRPQSPAIFSARKPCAPHSTSISTGMRPGAWVRGSTPRGFSLSICSSSGVLQTLRRCSQPETVSATGITSSRPISTWATRRPRSSNSRSIWRRPVTGMP